MPHQRDVFHISIFFVDQIDHLIAIANRREMLSFKDIFLVQVKNLTQNLGGSYRTRIRTRDDQVNLRFQFLQSLRDLLHFLFSLVGQRAQAVVFVFGRSRLHCDCVTNDVQVHDVSPR